LLSFLTLATRASAQQAAPDGLDPNQATKLAELMCRQLPNVQSVKDALIEVQDPNGGSPTVEPPKDVPVWDDVEDTLEQLGRYSVPCLVDRLADARWMPDPRMEPLVGVPVVGDVAYMILGYKGVPDVLPDLAHKKREDLRMDYWFWWPSVGDHRLRLQAAVRAWVLQHPNCCAAPPIIRTTPPSAPKSRMSEAELAAARTRFSRLRLGMSPAEVTKIAGAPDAIDPGGDGSDHYRINLLGYCADDHNESLAYIYFIERWTDEIPSRDPLRDRYVILFYSAKGKFTRMFSNVADIPPIFPSTEAVWEGLIWGEPAKNK
jgi:hypothetical protein